MTTENPTNDNPISFGSFKTSNFQAVNNTQKSLQNSFHFLDNEIKDSNLKSALLTGTADSVANKVLVVTKRFEIDSKDQSQIVHQLTEYLRDNEPTDKEAQLLEQKEGNK